MKKNRKFLLVGLLVVGFTVLGLGGYKVVHHLRSSQSFDTSTSKGEAAYEKKAKAQMVKCPNNNEAGLVLGGNLLPNTTQKTTSNRWATITETYATKADGPHPHFKVTLKTVGGKKASLCDDYFVAKSSTGKQKVTIDALVGGEATSPYAIDKDGNGSAQLNVDLTTP